MIEIGGRESGDVIGKGKGGEEEEEEEERDGRWIAFCKDGMIGCAKIL